MVLFVDHIGLSLFKNIDSSRSGDLDFEFRVKYLAILDAILDLKILFKKKSICCVIVSIIKQDVLLVYGSANQCKVYTLIPPRSTVTDSVYGEIR